MRSLTARLEDGYCSITVVNHRLITVIRFVVKSYTHLWKDFANKLRLILHAYEIFFSKIVCVTHATTQTKQGPEAFPPPAIGVDELLELDPYKKILLYDIYIV